MPAAFVTGLTLTKTLRTLDLFFLLGSTLLILTLLLQIIRDPTKPVMEVVGFDCEMVGVGEEGETSALARATVLNQEGRTLLDRYVRPQQEVTDYRTDRSGIRPQDLGGAPSFQQVRNEVISFLEDKGRVQLDKLG